MVSTASSAPPDPGDITATIGHFLARHALERGDAIAVEDAEHRLSYAELQALASAVGELAEGADVGQGPVGILLPISCSYIAAIAGLLARGIAYVPLDASFPAARNADIAARAGLKATIVDADTAAAMTDLLPDLPQIAMPTQAAPRPFPVTAVPDDVAVIFYTSGSTGQPKGVYQSQRAIIYDVLHHCWRAGLQHDDRIALLYSPSVSGSTRDIYGSLAAGARLCLVDVRRQGFGEATRHLADWQISVMHIMPGVFRVLAAPDSEAIRRLAHTVRLVHFISDRVLHGDVALYRQRFERHCRLCIDLATTETYSYASWYLDHDTPLDGVLVPVGYPAVPGKKLSLIDEAGRPVAPGTLGEIIVTGRSLSRGYWQDDALTRSRFLPSATAGATDFLTGDMGRLLPNGLLDFVGRKDRQVKIRGNSVHLAEVEAALSRCPGVAEAAAIARVVGEGASLIVYCAESAGEALDLATIKLWCNSHLPAFMQPAEIIILDALPHLPNGKPDGVALQRQDAERAARAVPAQLAALTMSAGMNAVKRAWETFLEPSSFERDVSLADAGADSLKALNLLLHLETLLGMSLGPSLLTMQTRPSELIGRLLQHRPPPDDAVAAADRRPLLFVFSGLYPGGPAINKRMEGLSTAFLPVIVDYSGGGDVFRGMFTADKYFDGIVARARREPHRRVVVIGMSYGGKLAAEAARRLIAAGLSLLGVIILDGVREDRFLRRKIAARRGVLLADRIRAGLLTARGIVNFLTAEPSRRLAIWFLSHGHYDALAMLLKRLASTPALASAHQRASRAVIAHIVLAAFDGMPDAPIATGLRLVLSNEQRFHPEAYPLLGWDACFDAIEVKRMDTDHLGFTLDPHWDDVVALLQQVAATASAEESA